MPIVRSFITYLAVLLLITSLLAYPVFETLQYTQLQETVLGQLSFRKVVDRLYLLSAILALLYLLVKYRLFRAEVTGLATTWRKGSTGFSVGFAIGLAMMSLSAVLLLVSGARYGLAGVLEDSLPGLLMSSFFFSALLIALLEETLFRGILLSQIGSAQVTRISVLLAAIFYAVVHFAKPGLDPAADEVTWGSAFRVLVSSFHKLAEPECIGSFLTLLVFALYLSFLRIHYRHLWVSIGVHTGVVLVIKLLFETTRSNSDAPLYWLVGNYDHVTGYVTAVVLLIIFLAHRAVIRKAGWK